MSADFTADKNAATSSSSASLVLDDMISKYSNDGNVDFEDDSTNDLFAAVARFAIDKEPLPETPEDIDAFLEAIPLFATKMPEEGKESDAFKAMKAIMNSQPSDKRADNFKESGNKAYKLALRLNEVKADENEFEREKRITARRQKIYDALNHYHMALDLMKEVTSTDKEEGEINRMNSALHSNIAQCHILLENYGHVVNAAKQAIKHNEQNHKAYYRAAFALNKLHKYQASFIVLRKAMTLQFEENSSEKKALLELAKKVITNWKRQEDADRAKAEKKKAAQEAAAQEKALLDSILAKRNIKMGVSQFKDMKYNYDGKVYVDEKKKLHFPLVFLYPDVMQSDFMADVSEYTTINDLLKMMFPPYAAAPQWDTTNQYVIGNLELYVKVGESESYGEDTLRIDASGGEMVTVNPSLSLGHALTALCKKGYVVPGFPTICVRPIKKL